MKRVIQNSEPETESLLNSKFLIKFSILQLPESLRYPSDQHRAHRETGADRREQHEVALLQPAAADRIVQRQRNRRGGGVAEPLDVDDRPCRASPSFSVADWMMRRLA